MISNQLSLPHNVQYLCVFVHFLWINEICFSPFANSTVQNNQLLLPM